MTTRRLLEVWQGNHSLEFRTRLKDGQPVPEPESAVLIIRAYLGPQPVDWCLDGRAVEELHQFTYDLLAGPIRDPRLEQLEEIVCGFTWMIGTLEVECCLNLNHGPISATVGHVTSRGTPFVSDPAF